jgi:hypothetical protein
VQRSSSSRFTAFNLVFYAVTLNGRLELSFLRKFKSLPKVTTPTRAFQREENRFSSGKKTILAASAEGMLGGGNNNSDGKHPLTKAKEAWKSQVGLGNANGGAGGHGMSQDSFGGPGGQSSMLDSQMGARRELFGGNSSSSGIGGVDESADSGIPGMSGITTSSSTTSSSTMSKRAVTGGRVPQKYYNDRLNLMNTYNRDYQEYCHTLQTPAFRTENSFELMRDRQEEQTRHRRRQTAELIKSRVDLQGREEDVNWS